MGSQLLSTHPSPTAAARPKLVIDSTGDEFFLVRCTAPLLPSLPCNALPPCLLLPLMLMLLQLQDDYQWWGQLPGDSYRYMEANAEHSQVSAFDDGRG